MRRWTTCLIVLLTGFVGMTKRTSAAMITANILQDTYITEQGFPFGGPDSNHGTSTRLELCGSPVFRSWDLVAFDLSPYAGQTVVGPTATVSLYVRDRYEDTASEIVRLRPILVPWNAGTVTLNTFGPSPGIDASDTGSVLASGTVSWPTDGLSYYSWSIPAATVQGWIDNPALNYGLLVESDTQGIHQDLTFDSSKAANTPLLKVEIVPEPSTAVLLLSIGGWVLMRRGRGPLLR